jgi:hypothetical protein
VLVVVAIVFFVVVSGDEKVDEKLRLLPFDSLYFSCYSIHYSYNNLLFYSIKKANLTG